MSPHHPLSPLPNTADPPRAPSARPPVPRRGPNLSHGQRQLVALGGVLAGNPEVLILDEATASIDTETELVIQDALAKHTEGRTSIIIAHRLQTIREAH